MGTYSRLNCEGVITAGAEITIDTQDEWHHLVNITPGSVCNGLTVTEGFTKSITAFADGGGGQVTVTAAAHGIPEDHYVSIAGTTNYNGLFQVTNVATNTFEITDTWVSDDGTGTVRHGTHVTFANGQGGDYIAIGMVSSTASAVNTTFEMVFLANNTVDSLSRRKFSTATDVGNQIVLGFFHFEPGDQMTIALRNLTSAANITINEAQYVIFRVS